MLDFSFAVVICLSVPCLLKCLIKQIHVWIGTDSQQSQSELMRKWGGRKKVKLKFKKKKKKKCACECAWNHGHFTDNHRRRKIIEEKNSPLQPVCSQVTFQDAQGKKSERRAGNNAQFTGTVMLLVDLFTCFQVRQVREANANVMLASTSAKNSQWAQVLTAFSS